MLGDFGERFGPSPPLLSAQPPEHSRHPIARTASPVGRGLGRALPLSVIELNSGGVLNEKPGSRDSGYPDWEPEWGVRGSASDLRRPQPQPDFFGASTLGRRRSEFPQSPQMGAPRHFGPFPRGSSVSDLHRIPSPPQHMFHPLAQVHYKYFK